MTEEKSKNLEYCIKNREIWFFGRGKNLTIDIENFGEYNQNLAKYLAYSSDDNILVKGTGLNEFLYKTENMAELADFAIEMLWSQQSRFKIYIEADINKINNYYPKKKEEWLENGFGEKVIDTAKWAPDKTQFEKEWHLMLCEMEGGRVGYPGYEWPRNKEEFDDVIKIHEQNFLIGDKEYLKMKIKDHIKNKFLDYDALINVI